MRSTIKIRFCDFHRHLPHSLEYFRALLASRYDLDERSDPDFVMYSNYGGAHRQFGCTRIFYSMENERPDFRECDYAITFDYINDPKHLRLPYYLMQPNLEQLAPRAHVSPDQLQTDLLSRTNFCGFVHSNPFGKCRNRLLQRLSRYKPVLSGGRYRNNVGYRIHDKIEFMRSCKFGFAFENDSHPGYTTEKLTDVFASGAIPIYWGNDRVGEEFNRRAMLSRHDFASDEALVERIIEIDQDDTVWCAYRSQPCFRENRLPAHFQPASVMDWFAMVFGSAEPPVAAMTPRWRVHARQFAPYAVHQRLRRFGRHSIKGVRLVTGW